MVLRLGFSQARVYTASLLPYFGGQGPGLADSMGYFSSVFSPSLPASNTQLQNNWEWWIFFPWGSMELLLSNLLEA